MSFAFDLLLFIFIIGVTYAALISEGFFRGIAALSLVTIAFMLYGILNRLDQRREKK